MSNDVEMFSLFYPTVSAARWEWGRPLVHTSSLRKYCPEDFCQVFPLPSFTLQDTTELRAHLDKLMCRIYTCRVSASMQGQEWLSHIDTMHSWSRFIGLLAWLYTFTVSAHAITLTCIGYRHKSHAVHAPHIPLWLVTMH